MSLLRRRMMSSIGNSNGGNENLKDYFCIENKGDVDVSVSFPMDSGYSYSFNQEVWIDTSEYVLSIPPKSLVYIAANGVDGDFSGYPLPVETNVSGNVMSLLYGHDFEDKYIIEEGQMLQGLFWNCECTFEGLRLPATVLRTPTAYALMFYNCVNMKNAPELPAHTLYEACYLGMFLNCVNLEKAPILPATTLATYCYNDMFSGCTRLNYIKMLATDISAEDCLLGWTDGVSLTGTFIKHPDMTSLPTGVNGIPEGWTVLNDGEEEEIPKINVYIVDKDEVLWEVDDWTGGDSAIGVGLVAGEHRFIVSKEVYNTSSYGSGLVPFVLFLDDFIDCGLTKYTTVDGTYDYISFSEINLDYTTWTSGALSDFSGKENTESILQHTTDDSGSDVSMGNLLRECNNGTSSIFNNYGFSDWYIPACGQLALISISLEKINAALEKIGGQIDDFNNHWTSTEYDSEEAWRIYFYDKSISHIMKIDASDLYAVRFIRDLNKPGTIDLHTASNGVYAVAKNGKGLTVNEADSSCIGVALITDNQRIMIPKSDATDGTNTSLYWSMNLYDKDVAGITETTDENIAKIDFNGKANTNAIIAAYTEHSVDMDSRDMCKVLETYAEGGFTDWYVPAAGQFYEMYNKKSDINAALQNIGGTALGSFFYWSSSEIYTHGAWRIGFYNGVFGDGGKRSDYRVRFVRDLVKIITFTIDSKSYQAEEGMMWGEWINSDYNTIGLIVDFAGNIKKDNKFLFPIGEEAVQANKPIIHGKVYELTTSGPGVV